MGKSLLHPQEIETFYVIPTIRRYMALTLLEQGRKQKDVAVLLGINSATISQYRSTKRGHKINMPPEIVQAIREAATRVTDTVSYFTQVQTILKLIRRSNVLCQIHHHFGDIPDHCKPQVVGCYLS